MCGIAGYYNFEKPIEKSDFDRMVDIVTHRGPDDRGVFYDGNLALGHRRLSIFDLSSAGHQPFSYKDRYVMVYNGEIYNYIELRAELEKYGYIFNTKTDTEVLVAAYDRYGKTCVEYFNGMWSFAIYDREKKELFCSRDRFGVKPFYYYFTENCFAFASEIKQILAILDENPKADSDSLLGYLICGDADVEDKTFFDGILRLQPGCSIIYDLTNTVSPLKIEKYYDLREVIESDHAYRESCMEFEKAFENSVRLRLRSDVPLGYCLSGGLDSSSIVCMANSILSESEDHVEQHSVSSCHYDKEYDEQEFIDEVVGKTGIMSHKLFLNIEGLWDDFDKLIWHMDEPVIGTAQYAQWAVFKEAQKNGLKVMLDGQGADEQIAGYTSFYVLRFAELIRKLRFKTLYKEYKAYVSNRAGTEKWVNHKEIIFVALISSIIPRAVSNRVRHLYGNDRRLPFTSKQKKRVYLKRTSYKTTNSRSYIYDGIFGGLQHLLHTEDRNSMAFSIESRVPFLDYKLVETLFAMPLEYKIRDGWTKAVLRDGLKNILPEKIFNRQSKLGFATPEDKWIHNNQQRIRDELATACDVLAPIVDKNMVLEWYDRIGKDASRGDSTVFRIICAGRWARIFNVTLNEQTS